jgi:Uma2 family endonuclease
LTQGDLRRFTDTTVRISPIDARDPDVCLAAAPIERGYLEPGEIALAVEVADASLARDLKAKRPEYASIGIPEYWGVDLPNRRVHVFRDPSGGDYRTALVFAADDTFESRGVAIRVSDLLP